MNNRVNNSAQGDDVKYIKKVKPDQAKLGRPQERPEGEAIRVKQPGGICPPAKG